MEPFKFEDSGLCAWDKPKRQRVHAIAQASWLRPVVKDVPEMRVAQDASHFVAAHSKA
jgi:hypothetical protein